MAVGLGYATFGRFVYLGSVRDKAVRRRAYAAGLRIVDAKTFRALVNGASSFERVKKQGVWHDTVKY